MFHGERHHGNKRGGGRGAGLENFGRSESPWWDPILPALCNPTGLEELILKFFEKISGSSKVRRTYGLKRQERPDETSPVNILGNNLIHAGFLIGSSFLEGPVGPHAGPF